ncbi:MAG: PAS domain S-box protein, partial [Rhodospirillales bacterium]|nr:PAS domain S-box protein [Rhodospirillales bacterium]
MAMVRPGAPPLAAGPRRAQFIDLLRSFPGQARLALGVDGVAWATVAGIVGLICCVVSFAQVALSLHATEVEHRQRSATEILALDQATRKLLRTIHLMSYGERQPTEVQVPLRSAWPQFQSALATVCEPHNIKPPPADRMRSACTTGTAMRDILAPEIEAFDPPTRLINSAEIGKVIALVGDFNSLSAVVARDADVLVGRMVDNYSLALLVLTLSTAGFAGAGLVLILLVGRASMRHFERWRQATEAAREAGEARDLLQETIDALPAGVVLYDQQERLVMFNTAAVAASPLLKRPNIIGITYEELARETGKLGQEFGAPLVNTPEEWIERFRSKGARRMRQSVEGRWFEWSEKLTVSGRTVGLRVDVTDLKTHELEVERTRDILQETIDSLPAGVVVYDKDERLVMFNKIAASVSPCLAQPGAIGKTYTELACDDARLNTAAGIDFGELPEQWIARFRSKGARHRRQVPDGRWIEWQEKTMQNGGTVGLRIDITDLKIRELEIERTRDLLQETIDTLPAGVVLYDRDERLVMFNKAAASITPGLASPGAIGKTYAELAYEAVRQNEAAGIASAEPPEQWIARFRSKGTRHLRQAPGGRWIEWLEKGTRDGGTLGLRVDVTELKTRELELERARADYQSLVDSLSDMVFKIDTESAAFTFVSAASTGLLGTPPHRLIGTRIFDHVAADDLEYVMATLQAEFSAPQGGVRQLQCRVRTASGAERHVEARFSRLRGDDGRMVIAGVMRDVEERAQLTRQLEKQMTEVEHARAEYQSLVDSLSDMVHKVEPRSTTITFASAASSEVLGWSPSQMIGTSALDYIVADDLDYVVAETQAALADKQGRVRQFQYRARTAGGTERHVEVRTRRMLDADGRPVVAGVMHDVEERVQLQRKLDAEMSRLRSIVESSGAMIILIDRSLEIVMVNSEFTAVTGLASEEAVGRPLKQVVDWPLDAAALDVWLSDPPGRERIKPARFTTWMPDRRGRQRLIAVTATPVTDEHGRVNSIVFLGVDDTERRETEEALFDAERLATIGEMAATVAHEIAQPLQVINIACSSVHDELAEAAERGGAPDHEFLAKKIDRIDAQVDRAGRIIGELRAFVRGTSQEVAGRFEPAVAVRAAVDLTQHAVRAAGIALTASISDPLPA